MSRAILDARYTSPSGKEAVFLVEKAKRDTELKTGVFVFPHRDGAHVQHQGRGARMFPLACIFSGPECMDAADAFEEMLIERGAGELQHPAYGAVKAVPTGSFSREDDLVEGINESAVTVTFTETIVDGDADVLAATAADAVAEAQDEFSEQAAADFASGLQTDDIPEQLAITGALEESAQSVSDNLQGLARSDKRTFADFVTSAKQLKSDIQNLYKKTQDAAGKIESVYVKALNIGRQVLRLMRLPSRAAVSISEKIKGYSELAADLINQYRNDPFGTRKTAQAYSAAQLAITGAVAAIAEGASLSVAEEAAKSPSARASAASGVLNGTDAGGGTAGVSSREEAVLAANTLVRLLEETQEFADTKIAANAFVDSDSAAYLSFLTLVRNSAKLVLNASFSLPLQKTVTLDRDRQAVELCAELYGEIDEKLDGFIALNNFNIDEIQLIPMGRSVSYYVENA
jgi:prophage DNA circulation protein